MTYLYEGIGLFKDGKLSCGGAMRQALASMEGKHVHVRLTEVGRKRSLKQNAYYWSVIVARIREAINEHGNNFTHEDVHDYLKQHVGKVHKFIMLPDGTRQMIFSSRNLKVSEFENYMEQCRAWAAANLGIIVELPNERI